MSETTQIVVGVIVLIVVYILTRQFHAWQMRRAYTTVLKDLRQKEAFDPSSAVELPYAKVRIFRVGTRDYRPKAVQYMTETGVAAMTDDGRYYLTGSKGR
ncbi:MAG: hypothetical protein JRJ09_15155 [Deltaproteobacteria bacterium]|nr:hypothetical protein [Deltaproteobacteria bacterium]MBW2049846.1 hypothetical protein [Deltaproteobacteria bacterium]MBW2112647.1 hypothetical protein [Deltaproteobacteria bacterium]MBW2354627.1 hypothetical protein [Deltaproteobacteria bacterium]HDZ90813.1 hypothetical protein [Deltaproteobacteria bacterium]